MAEVINLPVDSPDPRSRERKEKSSDDPQSSSPPPPPPEPPSHTQNTSRQCDRDSRESDIDRPPNRRGAEYYDRNRSPLHRERERDYKRRSSLSPPPVPYRDRRHSPPPRRSPPYERSRREDGGYEGRRGSPRGGFGPGDRRQMMSFSPLMDLSDYYEELEELLEAPTLLADADTHVSRNGEYARDPDIKIDVSRLVVSMVPCDILDENDAVGALIAPSYLQHLRNADVGRVNHNDLLCAMAERWWDSTNTFHFSWGELTLTPIDFSVITGIPFGTREVEVYRDWRVDIPSSRMIELVGIDMPRDIALSAHSPSRCVSRHFLVVEAAGYYSRYRAGDVTPQQAARFSLLLLLSGSCWSNRKGQFNPGILKSLEDLTELTTYDWAGLIMARMYDDMCCLSRSAVTISGTYYFWETWAYEYFPFARPELIQQTWGLSPLAWRWYGINLQLGPKRSLIEMRRHFDTCVSTQVEVGAMSVRLRDWIRTDPRFERSNMLAELRFVLKHPLFRRYYLGERVCFQVWESQLIPVFPPEDMRASVLMVLTPQHQEGIPCMSLTVDGNYDNFCQCSLMLSIGNRLDDIPRTPRTRASRARANMPPCPSVPGTSFSQAAGPSGTAGPLPRSFQSTRGASTSRPSSSIAEAAHDGGEPLYRRVPQAIAEATSPVDLAIADLCLPYWVSYHTPEGTTAYREVSLNYFHRYGLPPASVHEVPDGLLRQMMDLMGGLEEELSAAWTVQAFEENQRKRPRR